MPNIDQWVSDQLDKPGDGKEGLAKPLFSFDHKEMATCSKATRAIFAHKSGEFLQPNQQNLPPFF
jgi:hypothetical protein